MESAQKLFTKMYEQNAAARTGSLLYTRTWVAPESSANDDVVDGDYKEFVKISERFTSEKYEE